jgi:hypothetical protein
MTAASRTDRAAVRRQLRQILLDCYGVATGTLHITVADDAGHRVTWDEPEEAGPALPDTDQEDQPKTTPPESNGALRLLSPLEADIVHALSTGTLKGATIAGRLALAYDGRLKIILANLVERGVLATTREGYMVSRVYLGFPAQ